MTKNIKFIPFNKSIAETEPAPTPAKKHIPQWFKDMPIQKDDLPLDLIANNRELSFPSGRQTIKRCMPFMDSLTSGYIVSLPQDIEVSKDLFGNIILSWKVDRLYNESYVNMDRPFRVEGLAPSKEYEDQPFRIVIGYSFETPPGYSALLMHPLNRLELPFTTISGVVDSDKFAANIVANIFIKKGFEGVIERGTPVAQILPFKRDDWTSTIADGESIEQRHKRRFELRSKIVRGYQNLIWQKKNYS